jgi:hypothetical protein
MFRHPLRAVLPAVRYSPTAFSVRPIHFCTLPAFFSVSLQLPSRVVRHLSDLLFDLAFYFVKLALGPVLRAWFHHFSLFIGFTPLRDFLSLDSRWNLH